MADDEQLRRNHIIGDGGEDEGKSTQSPPEKKQELDEESGGAEEEMEDSDGAKDGEDDMSDGTGEDDVLTSEYDSDDSGYFIIDNQRLPNRLQSDYLPDGAEGSEEVDVDKWSKYYQEIRESEGFDINHYPGCCIMAPYHPFNAARQNLFDYSVAAVNDFNQKEGTKYKLEKVEKANARLWGCGANHYITFQARESVADALKTFQALVWWGIDGSGSEPFAAVVKFCRLKATAAT
ncbi:uncharacterized protein LOC113762504 [Coffea eugenioides]|uniref:uncharacterized protein LOC113762504 n=1 Tax=Coffea eugenioides TaxID=49369 RepID=UPI000F6061E1|nr:uncharacterized protein LOC113762504 [Coffea eugenioides]